MPLKIGKQTRRLLSHINPLTSIRARIGFAITILTLVLTFILTLVIGRVALQQVETSTKLFSARTARGFALYTDTAVEQLIDNLELATASLYLSDPPQFRDELRFFDQQFSEIDEVHFTTTNGIIIFSSNRAKEGQQILTDYHAQMLHTNPIRNEFDIARSHIEQTAHQSETPAFYITVPMFDNKTLQFIGALSARMHEDWIFQIAGRVPFDDNSELIVLAMDGTPVIGEIADQAFAMDIVKNDNPADLRYALYESPNGATNLVGYAPVLSGDNGASLGWTIVLQRPLEIATAPVIELQEYILGVGIFLVVIFSVMGWVLAGKVVQPLQGLVDTTQRIRQNEPDAEFKVVDGQDELAILSQSLAVMMKALKKQSEARQLSEDRFSTVFRESLDVILVLDGDTGIILSANPVIVPVLGYEPHALIGVHFSQLIPHSDDNSDFIQQLNFYGSVFETLPFLRADGGLCPMDLTATVIPWSEETAILVTLRDVSEREVAAAALQKAEKLRAELEREREFARLKEAFISMVSHEFRTPLTIIASSASIIQSYYDRLSDERKHGHLNKIVAQTAYLTSMMDDMLTLSKAQSGRLEFNPEPMNVTAFCNDILHQIQQIDSAQHRFNIQMNQHEVETLADKQLLRHILFNLLSNAIKYSPLGTTVWFSLANDGEQLEFMVRDEGIGIPEDQQKKLFTPFYRAKNVGNIKGTGLGLSIVKESVEVYDGKIEYVSVPERGTKFTVQLPIPKATVLSDGTTF